MFRFAAKNLSTKATESLVEKDDTDIRRSEDLNLSEAARHASILGCLDGIVCALARLLKLKGKAPEEIVETINPLIASCVASGDLSKQNAEWVRDSDWYASSQDYIPSYCTPSDSMWSFYHDIIESTKCSRLWSDDIRRDLEKNIDPQEKAILDAFEKARDAYYDAMRIRDEFFAKKAATVLHDVLRKYESQISAIDEEFFKFMSHQVAETLSQLADDNSCPSDPNIKNEVQVQHEPINLDHPND